DTDINKVITIIVSFFFFFQAEDGIRDFHVTGVQTCALPIYIVRKRSTSRLGNVTAPLQLNSYEPENGRFYDELLQGKGQARAGRSEERRVGKECRSRG